MVRADNSGTRRTSYSNNTHMARPRPTRPDVDSAVNALQARGTEAPENEIVPVGN
jgi:hypothetical protein